MAQRAGQADAQRRQRAAERKALGRVLGSSVTVQRPVDALRSPECLPPITRRREAVSPALIHDRAVTGAVFSPDGTLIVTASWDHTARIWDAAGNPLSLALTHQGSVYSAAFCRDGTRVVTASADHTARVWDVASGQPLSPPLAHQGAVVSAAFSSDGARVVTASWDTTARVWFEPSPD